MFRTTFFDTTKKEKSLWLAKQAEDELERRAVNRDYQKLLELLQHSDFTFSSFIKAIKSSPLIEPLTSAYLHSADFMATFIMTEDNAAKQMFSALLGHTQLTLGQKKRLLDFLFNLLSTDDSIAPHWAVFYSSLDTYFPLLVNSCQTNAQKQEAMVFLEKFFTLNDNLVDFCNAEKIYFYLVQNPLLDETQCAALEALKNTERGQFFARAATILNAQFKPNLDYLKFIYLYAQRHQIPLSDDKSILQTLLTLTDNYFEFWNLKKISKSEAEKITYCTAWLKALSSLDQIEAACEQIRGGVKDETFNEYILPMAKQQIIRLELNAALDVKFSGHSRKIKFLNSSPEKTSSVYGWFFSSKEASIYRLIHENRKKAERAFREEQAKLDVALYFRVGGG